MANITAADVNKLRQITGSGMMDCKNALIESEGDFDKAIEILRKKGLKVANKRADRNSNEGMVLAATSDDHTFGALIMLSCETDFVANNTEFSSLTHGIMKLVMANRPKTKEELEVLKLDSLTVAEHITHMMGKTGEKMDLAHYQFIEAPIVAAYNHHGNRLGTLLGMSKAEGTAELARELAMQVAAMAPVAIDKEDVDAKTIEQEIEIGKEQARQEGKPEDMLERIAQGKLQKFYKESTLLNQEYVKDTKIDVRSFIARHDKDLRVVAFKRVMLGA